jgi:cell division transport system ATP-binding protein
MIEFNNVSKKYRNGFEALKQATFKIQRGEMCFLTGHSGAGKSTILKLIASLETASFGHIEVNNQSLINVSRREIPAFRRKIGIVLQNPHLIPEQTVAENVALPLIIDGLSKNEIAKRVRAGLDKVNLLDKEHFFPEELSTGEQQRVSLARAVASKPDLILADEPTGNLDPELSLEILRLFRDFNHIGTTILIATHDIDLISQFNCRILHVEHGIIRTQETNANNAYQTSKKTNSPASF